jgi:hypothetical protein
MQQPVAESRADRQLSVHEEQDRLTRTTARVCAATDPQSYAAEAGALRAALQASELARENLAQENLMLRAATDRHAASGILYDQEALKALLPSDLLSEIPPAGDLFSVTAALEPAAAADMITSQIWQPGLSSPTSSTSQLPSSVCLAWPEAAEALPHEPLLLSPAASPLQEPPSPDGSAQRALAVEEARKKLDFEDDKDLARDWREDVGPSQWYYPRYASRGLPRLRRHRAMDATMIQAAYRGHRARRGFSAARTSHDGNKQATSVSPDGCCSFLIFIPISTSSPAATMVQAAYRGHRARRGFSAVRTSHDGKPPAITRGHLTATLMAIRRRARRSVSAAQNSQTSLDGIQPTISAGNLYPSLDGNKQAEPGHCGSSVLSAAAEVFLPNDAHFVSKLVSSARQHTRAMKAHADPQKATVTDLFWPPDVQVDADPAMPEAT